MNSAVQKYLEAATGLTNVTKARAEKIVKQLVKQGEAATDQAGELVDELLERQRQNREQITQLVKNETQRAIKAMGLASRDDVDRLKKQVTDLRRQLSEAKKAAPAKKTAAKKTTAKKTTAKKTAAKKSTAKKSTAKKSPAKKTAAKKSTAKKSTTKKSTGSS